VYQSIEDKCSSIESFNKLYYIIKEEMRKNKKLKILAISAHPDDMEFEAGGTLGKWALKGHEIYHLVLTAGEYRDLNEKIHKTEKLRKEAQNAAKVLSIKELIFFDYTTTELPCSGKLVSEVDKIVQDVCPDIIISHHPFDSHQDHRAAAEIVFAVSRQGRVKNVLSSAPFPYRPNVFAFRPQFFVDISSTIDIKLEAIRCYKSQFEKFGNEKLTDRIQSWARVWGWAVELEFAECFEVIRMSDVFDIF